MPKVKHTQDGEISWLRPFEFLGVDITGRAGTKQSKATCPFCQSEKFFIGHEQGLWDCKVCGVSGNPVSFLRKLHAYAEELTTTADYQELAEITKVQPSTVQAWKLAKNPLNGQWLLPAYHLGTLITQLYQYTKDYKTKKYRMYATPEMGQGLLGVPQMEGHDTVWICEGFKDGMRVWEALRSTKEVIKPDGEAVYSKTAAEKSSLATGIDVLAIPGANTFKPEWLDYTQGKHVALLMDNDNAGTKGAEKITHILTSKQHPMSVRFLQWDTTKFSPGYDMSDLLLGDAMVDGIAYTMENLVAVPDDWKAKEAKCDSWKECELAWRKAMRWTPGLSRALSVMLSSIISTPAKGDQLWIKLIGPASCGKSTLCEAVSRNKKHVLAKSSIRGFHSGFKSNSNDETEDNSLLVQARGKTLVTKDGDTLLQAPNLTLILSEARDIYDGATRTHYRNKMSRDYTGVKMTWILCGTSSLRSLDSSELGERFLDCVIMETIDDEMEDEVLLRVANRTEALLSMEEDGSEVHPDMENAMSLTSGYITYLMHDVSKKIGKVHASEQAIMQCVDLGKFVAFMRARPSDKQEENASREFGARLVSQLVRLAKCMGVVMQRDTLDNEVMKRVTQVAIDTARGRVYNICKALYERPMTLKNLTTLTNNTEAKDKILLNFLKELGAVQCIIGKATARGYAGKSIWKMTESMHQRFGRVMKYLE